MRAPGRLPVAVLVLLAAAAGAWLLLRPSTTEEEIASVEQAWRDIRDAIIQGDDEAFFEMHSRRAREDALEEFPLIRSRYLASDEAEREAFCRLYRVTDQEFRTADPRELVLRMVPWKSGWKERIQLFRRAVVKDVQFTVVRMPDGTEEREARVLLDISGALAPGEMEKVGEEYLPAVVFVKDPEGWRRRALFGN